MGKTSLIVFCRNDGIGGRLKGMLAGLRMAVKYNIPFVIIWENAPRYCCPFESILDPKAYNWIEIKEECWNYDDIHNKAMRKVQNGEIIYHAVESSQQPLKSINQEDLLKIWFDPTKSRLKLDKKYVFGDNHINKHDIVIMNSCPKFAFERPPRTIQSPIHVVKFNPQVLEVISQFYKKHQLSEKGYLGVHLRRGDFVSIGKISAVVPEAKYFQEIQAYDERTKTAIPILLCTESEIVINTFKNKYGSRLILHEASGYGFQNEDFVRDAVIDFVLLSKSKAIIGSNSAFTQMATHIGDIVEHSKFLVNKPHEWQTTEFTQYINRLNEEILARKAKQILK